MPRIAPDRIERNIRRHLGIGIRRNRHRRHRNRQNPKPNQNKYCDELHANNYTKNAATDQQPCRPCLSTVADSPVAPFRFSGGGLRKGLLTFGTRVKLPFAQSATRHQKIAQSHKSRDITPKFQLFSALPRIPHASDADTVPNTWVAIGVTRNERNATHP